MIEQINILFVGPDQDRFLGVFVGKEGDGRIGVAFQVAEADDIALGFEIVQGAVGAREGLDQAVVFQIFIDVERVERFGVEAGEEHIDDEQDVDGLGRAGNLYSRAASCVGRSGGSRCRSARPSLMVSLLPNMAL